MAMDIAIRKVPGRVSLRARLTLFFVGIVVVPLLAAVLVLESIVGQEMERRTDTRLEGASLACSAIWQTAWSTLPIWSSHQPRVSRAAAAGSRRSPGGRRSRLPDALRSLGGDPGQLAGESPTSRRD
jgi:hypothetical protein